MNDLSVLERTKKYWINGDLQSFCDGWLKTTRITDIIAWGPIVCIKGQDFNLNMHVSVSTVVRGPEPGWVYIHSSNQTFRIRPAKDFRWTISPKCVT